MRKLLLSMFAAMFAVAAAFSLAAPALAEGDGCAGKAHTQSAKADTTKTVVKTTLPESSGGG